MEIRKPVMTTISVYDNSPELCAGHCQYLASVEDLDKPLGASRIPFCNRYLAKLWERNRCDQCIREFDTGEKENG